MATTNTIDVRTALTRGKRMETNVKDWHSRQGVDAGRVDSDGLDHRIIPFPLLVTMMTLLPCIWGGLKIAWRESKNHSAQKKEGTKRV